MSRKKLFIIWIAFALFFGISKIAFGFTFARTIYGDKIHWPSRVTQISMYVHSSTTGDLATATTSNIIDGSLSEWNNEVEANITINGYVGNGTISSRRNDIYFSSSPTIFSGSSVVGITQIAYDELTGEILEADIILNDNNTFSDISSDQYYLGNVVTHELGHVLGLGHSEVHESTMFYALGKGQHSIEPDDEAGVFTKYPTASSRGVIEGKVVGGDSSVGIFGAHVQAISSSTGKVAAGVLSDSNGSFSISGLPLNDTYYLYIGPARYISALPYYYSTARKDFCIYGEDYKGSFFQSCETDRLGYPEAIPLTTSASSKTIGNITIRCNVDVPYGYLDDHTVDFDFSNFTANEMGGSFVGFFTEADFTPAASPNVVNVDLPSAYHNTTNFLEIKVLHESINSKVGINVTSVPDATPVPIYSTEYNKEYVYKIPLDAVSSTVQVEISPSVWSGALADYFPDAENFLDSRYLYFLSMNITDSDGNVLADVHNDSNHVVWDNSYCTEGNNSYAVGARVSQKPAELLVVKQEEDNASVSCGTIGPPDSNSSGPMNFAIGLIFSFIFLELFSKRQRTQKVNH